MDTKSQQFSRVVVKLGTGLLTGTVHRLDRR